MPLLRDGYAILAVAGSFTMTHNHALLASALVITVAIIAATGGCKDRSQSTLTDLGASHAKYKPGQVWHYRSRAGEEQSTLTILKVESHPKLGTIVHVALAGLQIKNPKAPGGLTSEATHLPFSEKSVDDSVTTVAGPAGVVPDYLDGYNTWRESFDAGKAGVFTITVAEAVDVMERGLANAKRE
jgi:hypothetical protein